jgi:hypothetical protein
MNGCFGGNVVLDKRDNFRQDIGYAFLTDRLVVEAIRFLERRSATPSTLFAVNGLVQAIILHDHIIIGLASMAGANLPEYQHIRDKLGADVAPRIVGPSFGELQGALRSEIYYWLTPITCPVVKESSHEAPMLSVLLDFLQIGNVADLVLDEDRFCERFGIKGPYGRYDAQVEDQRAFDVLNSDLKKHGRQPISPNDLLSLRDQAGLAAAGIAIGKATGRDVYHALHERPFIANEMQAQGPKKLVGLMEKALYEGPIIGFENIDVPPFLGMVISGGEDWLEKFWERVISLRERHAAFRKVYGDFQIAWRSANRGEQRILKQEYDRAWAALLEKVKYRREQRFSHMTLQALLSGGKSVAKMAIEVDRFDQAICRVGGLVKLWTDMNSITSQENARSIIARKCPDVASERQWREIARGIQWAQRSIEDACT